MTDATVMVVEDDCELLEALVDTLSSAGYKVVQATDGAGRLVKLGRIQYDQAIGLLDPAGEGETEGAAVDVLDAVDVGMLTLQGGEDV